MTLAANRKREFSFAPPRVSHRDGFPIKNAERVFFIARADQKVFAANVTSGLRSDELHFCTPDDDYTTRTVHVHVQYSNR